jgi:integrase
MQMPVLPRSSNPNSCKPWTVRWTVNGQQSERSFRTKREADDFWASVEHSKREHSYIDPTAGCITFAEYAAQWLRQFQGSDNTLRIYGSVLDNHVLPALGDMQLRRITRHDIKCLLLDDMLAKKLSRSSIETARQVISGVLGKAVRAGRITENPAARIRLPQRVDAAEFYPATRRERETVTEGMPSDMRLAVWLMRGCGLRIGEVMAVNKACIRDGYLRLTEQLVESQNRLGSLKHRRPGQVRDVPLPRWVKAEIDKHLAEDGTDEQGYLFRRRKADSLRSAFMGSAKRAGLPPDFTPHSLRHLFASAALTQGLPVPDVTRWLGHLNIDITFRIYSHFIPSSLDSAQRVLDAESANAA